MTCPKCHGEMRQYERSSITIDQCTECRGIFLDRGELKKLIDAEASWSQSQGRGAAPQPAAVPSPPPVQQGYPAPAYEQQQYGHHGHYRQRKRKGGFLGDLFD